MSSFELMETNCHLDFILINANDKNNKLSLKHKLVPLSLVEKCKETHLIEFENTIASQMIKKTRFQSPDSMLLVVVSRQSIL